MLSRRLFLKKNAHFSGKILTLGALSGPAILWTSRAIAALRPTPSQAEGPFYPRTKPKDRDWNLIRFVNQAKIANGTPLDLRGRVLNEAGKPVSNITVEIWQCDHQGIYDHPDAGSTERFDKTFQGYGETETNKEGHYRFLTLVPAIYTGRPPHIHVKLRRDGEEILTTQLYIKGHPENGRDGLLAHLFFRNQEKLLMDLRDTEIKNIGKGKITNFDFVI